jgi:hypothetical protein
VFLCFFGLISYVEVDLTLLPVHVECVYITYN